MIGPEKAKRLAESVREQKPKADLPWGNRDAMEITIAEKKDN
jgi:hypothetical protein